MGFEGVVGFRRLRFQGLGFRETWRSTSGRQTVHFRAGFLSFQLEAGVSRSPMISRAKVYLAFFWLALGTLTFGVSI